MLIATCTACGRHKMSLEPVKGSKRMTGKDITPIENDNSTDLFSIFLEMSFGGGIKY